MNSELRRIAPPVAALPLLWSSMFAASAATYKISPGQLSLGTSYTITVTQDACKEGDAGATLQTAKLTTKVTGLSLTQAAASSALGCSAVWQIQVGSSAPLGVTNLVLLDKDPDGKLLALLPVEIVSQQAGPIPPGLERQVDVMWKVLPWQAVADSFGKKVASQYFAIQMTVGNNSGYPIQFSALGFRTPDMRRDEIPPLPNDPYNFPRSTIEKEQQVGGRAIIRHSIEAVAGVMAGFSGFVSGPKSDYGLVIGLASPVTTGFDLVWPDRTVRHLIAIDSRSFRDGIIVPNNVPSPPVLAFISREIVECKKVTSRTPACVQKVRGIERVPRNKRKFNPNEIMKSLGDLVLAGQPIYYLPRVSVSGNRVTPTPVPPVANPPGASGDVRQGTTGHTIPVTGNGLLNAAAAAAANTGVTIASQSVDPNGTSMTLTLNVSDNAPPGNSNIVVSTAAGTTLVPIRVVAAKPEIASLTPATAAQNATPAKITVQGKFLAGAAFALVTAAGNRQLTATPAAAGQFDVVLPIDAESEPADFRIVATRHGETSAPAIFKLTAATPVVETPIPASATKGTAQPVEVKILGQFLKGVKTIRPAAGSGITIGPVTWEPVNGASKPGRLTFGVNVKDAATGKWKLTLDNGGASVEVEFEVK